MESGRLSSSGVKKGKIFYLFIYCFETESHSVTQVGLELWATLLLQNLNSGITSISNYLYQEITSYVHYLSDNVDKVALGGGREGLEIDANRATVIFWPGVWRK